jgi:hypothetical protein
LVVETARVMMVGGALPSEKVWAWGAAPEKASSRGLAGGRLLMPGLARGEGADEGAYEGRADGGGVESSSHMNGLHLERL